MKPKFHIMLADKVASISFLDWQLK